MKLFEQILGVVVIGTVLLDVFLTVPYARVGTGMISLFFTLMLGGQEFRTRLRAAVRNGAAMSTFWIVRRRSRRA